MPLHAILRKISAFEEKLSNGDAQLDKMWSDFGAGVRSLRKNRNIGLKEFSRELKISKSMTGFLESGKRRWNLEMARRAVKILQSK